MIGFTQDQWFEKLKAAIPAHYFCDSDPVNFEAIFQGLAAVFKRIGDALDNHFRETFICQAVDGYLDQHGVERNITRTSGETTFNYSQRIKNITNTTSCPEIKRVVDALLDVGEASITEDFNGGVFFQRESFFNRGEILITPIKDTFSIVVDKQVHAPFSFFDREHFFDREDFIGRLESSQELFELIVETVNRNKACGTLYRLIERAG